MTPFQVVAKTDHVPFFVAAPGQTDVLFAVVALVLVGAVLAMGVFFFWLHSLPERMVHNRTQFDIVAALGLLSLFTHIHAFWVAALLLALIRFPSFSVSDFSGPLDRIANSLEGAKEDREAEGMTSDHGARATPLPTSAPTRGAEPTAVMAPKVKQA